MSEIYKLKEYTIKKNKMNNETEKSRDRKLENMKKMINNMDNIQTPKRKNDPFNV